MREKLPTFLPLLIAIPALVVLISLHQFFLRAPGPVGFDDGYTVAIGERLIDGSWLPYVDGVSHRGPMLYWLAGLAQLIGGRYDWVGPRWLVFLAALTSFSAIIGIGFAVRRPLAGAIGSIFFVWLGFVAHDTEAAFALSGEALAATFGVLGLLATTLGLVTLERRRLWAIGAAGFFVSLAGFTKQTAFPLLVPLAIWVACVRWRWLAALAAGAVLPAMVILGRYAIAGELGTFWYWFYGYNADIYMAVFEGVSFWTALGDWVRGHPWQFGALVALVTIGIVQPILDIESFPKGVPAAYAKNGLEATTALMTAVAFAAIASPKRFWFPYFILLFPFVSLLVGIRGEALVERGRGSFWAKQAGTALLGVLLALWLGLGARVKGKEMVAQRRQGLWLAALPEPMCDVFDRHTQTGDPVFVWGFDADLYVTCKRKVATRYTYLTLVAGTVPPFFTPARLDRVARGAREQILEDLHATEPKLILDMTDRMRGVSLRVVPELAAYVDAGYCRVRDEKTKTGRPAHVWVRRDLGACQ